MYMLSLCIIKICLTPVIEEELLATCLLYHGRQTTDQEATQLPYLIYTARGLGWGEGNLLPISLITYHVAAYLYTDYD